MAKRINRQKKKQFKQNPPTIAHQKTVPIKGMHCASCELLITDELEGISGVESAKVSLKSSAATIRSSRKISSKEIEYAVRSAGYEVGLENDKKSLITLNKSIWRDAAIGVVFVAAFFVIFQLFGIDNIAGTASANGGAGTMALLIGLTAGFSTCMALIGGLVLSVASKYAENHPMQTARQKFTPHVFFNLGRIISFIILGAVIGWIGSAFALKGSLLGLLTIAVGLVMLILGLQLTELFPRITKGITLPSGISKRFGLQQRKGREYSNKNALLLGAATFFLPCGFTQAMQLLAVSTGDPIQAALIMGAFAVGTAPGLLGLGGLTSVVKGVFAQKFFRIVGVIVVAMALLNFVNGYNLSGLNRFFDNLATAGNTSSKVEEIEPSKYVRVLTTTFHVRTDITPNVFTTKIGQKTILSVDVKENGEGCMSTIMIIGLDDKPQYLAKGKKIELTFTPEKPGKYTIACAMGVARGSITVKE